MTEGVNRRRYTSAGRAAAARATRARILEAARTELLERGYAGATVSSIAAAAGVAVDTVYAAVGRKPDLLRLALETAVSGTDEVVPPEERGYVRAIRAEPRAEAKLRLYAQAVCEMGRLLWPLQRVLAEGAAHDPALRQLRDEMSLRRASNLRAFAADVAAADGARPVRVEELADVVWATSSPEMANLLVGERGWAVATYERWLVSTWGGLALGPGGPPTGPAAPGPTT